MSGEREAPPWVAGDLVIERAVLDGIHAHARECYPNESCGLISGPAGDPALLVHAERQDNEADKYHKLDPIAFPRTARTYFKMNELKVQRAFDAAEQAGRPIKVIYHSHCDAGAYFSQEDSATFAMANTLTWPCAFIVVSVVDGEVRDTKLWVHVTGTNDFRESSLRVR